MTICRTGKGGSDYPLQNGRRHISVLPYPTALSCSCRSEDRKPSVPEAPARAGSPAQRPARRQHPPPSLTASDGLWLLRSRKHQRARYQPVVKRTIHVRASCRRKCGAGQRAVNRRIPALPPFSTAIGVSSCAYHCNHSSTPSAKPEANPGKYPARQPATNRRSGGSSCAGALETCTVHAVLSQQWKSNLTILRADY